MIDWNPDGFKVGLCSTPPVGAPHSVLCLANNTAIAVTFEALRQRFAKLYSRKAHIHHYTEYMDVGLFDEALEALVSLVGEYTKLDGATPPLARPLRSASAFASASAGAAGCAAAGSTPGCCDAPPQPPLPLLAPAITSSAPSSAPPASPPSPRADDASPPAATSAQGEGEFWSW